MWKGKLSSKVPENETCVAYALIQTKKEGKGKKNILLLTKPLPTPKKKKKSFWI